MTPERALTLAVRPALSMLPTSMTSREAEALLLTIALQESHLEHRRQMGGPGRSFWQFEFNGVNGVLRHEASRPHALHLCEALDVEPVPGTVHAALEYQDVLAAGFARLLLWTLPSTLPGPDEPNKGWGHYLLAWRPGKPRRETFHGHFARAWQIVTPR